jgi:hypothetical protein
MKNKPMGIFALGFATAALAGALTVLPYHSSNAASKRAKVFSPGRSYSVHLAGFDDRTVKVITVSGRWLQVKDRSGSYWLNSDWILEQSAAR